MKPVYYSKWPRKHDGSLLFESTHEALFYAAQVYNNDDLIEELQGYYNRVLERFALLEPISWRNLTFLSSIIFDCQFYRECLEEITRLRVEREKTYRFLNSAAK